MSDGNDKINAIPPLSLNQMTVDQWEMEDAVAGCVEAGVTHIGLWRHKVEAFGLDATARLVRDAGMYVSSLCRGGYFPATTAEERRRRIDDNKRAIDEAHTLGTDTLVLVCGPAGDKDIGAARRQVEEGIEAILPHAKSAGVRLGIEPLHPMFAADRSVIVTLQQANAMVKRFNDPFVGVIIDVYHVWWDPDLYAGIESARGTILGFHINDWIVPLPDPLNGRGMPGAGVIEISNIYDAVVQAGYTGPVEVEIFNESLWAQPGSDVMNEMKNTYEEALFGAP